MQSTLKSLKHYSGREDVEWFLMCATNDHELWKSEYKERLTPPSLPITQLLHKWQSGGHHNGIARQGGNGRLGGFISHGSPLLLDLCMN